MAQIVELVQGVAGSRTVRVTVQRTAIGGNYIGGVLLVNGQHECYTLEDKLRAPGVKVAGATAIPAGIYALSLGYSDKQRRVVPWLREVPGFTAVQVHPGNKIEDTEGCILVGQVRTGPWIGLSVAAFDALMLKLMDAKLRGAALWLEVVNPTT